MYTALAPFRNEGKSFEFKIIISYSFLFISLKNLFHKRDSRRKCRLGIQP